ncbi:hypothetical protein HDU76_003858 [Blyttiomyces sp. JEL0837]|nr:hypothetical protein HDU76_003858 [Blyttiomyces sp. JEL0837]
MPGFTVIELPLTTYCDCAKACHSITECESSPQRYTWFANAKNPINGEILNQIDISSGDTFTLGKPTIQPSPQDCVNLCQSTPNCLWVSFVFLADANITVSSFSSSTGFKNQQLQMFMDNVHSSLTSTHSTDVYCELRKAVITFRGPGTGFLLHGSGRSPEPGESNNGSNNGGTITPSGNNEVLFPALHPRCSGTQFQYIEGVDIYGFDMIAIQNVQSVCDYFFVYRTDGTCWLKKTEEPSASYTWFPESANIIPGDLPGHDLGDHILLQSGDQCTQLCTETPDCLWTNFVYEAATFFCHLKAADEDSESTLGFRVQYSSKALTPDTVVVSGIDIPGFVLSQFKFTTQADCSTYCKQNKDCDFFTTGNSCMLKTTNKSDTSIFTWFKRSNSPIKGYLPHGPNNKSFDLSPPTNQPSPFACFNLCQSNNNCLWVNYNYIDNTTSTSVSCIQRNGVMGRGMNIGFQIIPMHNVVSNWNDTIIPKNVSSTSSRASTTTTASSSPVSMTTEISVIFNFTTTTETTTLLASIPVPSTDTKDITTTFQPVITNTATGSGTATIVTTRTGSSKLSTTGSVTSQTPSPTRPSQQEDSSTASVKFTPAVIAVSTVLSSLIILLSFIVGVWVGKRSIGNNGGAAGGKKDSPKVVDVVNIEYDDENPVTVHELEDELSSIPATTPWSNELNPSIQASTMNNTSTSINLQVTQSMYARRNRGDGRGGFGFAMGIGVDGDAVDISLESELQRRNGVYSVWSHERVMEWVNLKKLDQDVIDVFTNNNFDGPILATIDVRLLTEKYHVQDSYLRSKIMSAVKSLRLGSRAVVGNRGIGEMEPPAYGET